MQNIPMRPQRRKPFRLAYRQDDLFTWAENRIPNPPPPMPRAVSYLTRRFGISPTYAALAASLSGLGGMNHE
jgi:hypothetical protein